MRENLLKKQPTWGLRRAQGTGQKSATPSAAWGQTVTVTKTIKFKKQVDAVTSDIKNSKMSVSVTEQITGESSTSYNYDGQVIILDDYGQLSQYSCSTDGGAVFTLKNDAPVTKNFAIEIPGVYPNVPTQVTLTVAYNDSGTDENKIKVGDYGDGTQTTSPPGTGADAATYYHYYHPYRSHNTSLAETTLTYTGNNPSGLGTNRDGPGSLIISISLSGGATFTIKEATITYETNNYGLTVAGIPVTGVNAADILGDQSSSVSFEGTTPATLTLNGANINYESGNVIVSTLTTPLEVVLLSNSNINSGSYLPFEGANNTNLVFKTSGGDAASLVMSSTYDGFSPTSFYTGFNEVSYEGDLYAYLSGDKIVAIEKATSYGLTVAGVPVTSVNCGDILDGENKGKVSFKPMSLGADQTSIPATLTLNNANITGSIIFNADLTVHLVGDNTITKPEDASSFYAFDLGNTARDLNFSTDETKPGTLKFVGLDHSNLQNYGIIYNGQIKGGSATIGTTGDVIWKQEFSPDGVTPSYFILSLNKHYNLWKNGHQYHDLILDNNDGYVFNPEKSTLTITNSSSSDYINSGLEDLTIIVSGSRSLSHIAFGAPAGTQAEGITTGTLTIKKNETSSATVNGLTLTYADGGVISGFSSVTIEEPMGVKSPSPFTTWEGTHNAIISDEVLYDLWVRGVQVTSGNASNIIGDQSSQHTAVFDASGSILTLNGLQIFNSTSSPSFIESGLENLTVILSGENKFMKGGDVTTSYGFKVQGDKTRKITFTTSNNGSINIDTNAENAVVGFTNVTYNDGLAPYMWNSKFYIAPVTLEKPAFIGNYDEEDSSKLLSVSIDSHATSTIDSNSEPVPILAYNVVYTVDGGSETAYSESEPITISGPCTLTAKTIVGNTSSEVATGKYFGAKQEVFTVAIGDKIEGTSWFTPEITTGDQISSEFMLQEVDESGVFERKQEENDFYLVAKKSGTTTVNASLWSEEGITVLNSGIALTFNVGESLNSVFEGENTFGGLYSETNIQVPEGMKAYIITGIDEEKGTVITSPVDFIPAGVPVMLENEGEAKAITHVPYTGSATAPTNNKLNYSNPNTPAKSSATDNWYVIYNNKFVKVTTGTEVRGGKCYLNLNGTSSSGTRSYYDIDGSDGTTGIREVKSEGVKGEKLADSAWHDLQGRKFTTKPTKPGLYILNGKKVVIK